MIQTMITESFPCYMNRKSFCLKMLVVILLFGVIELVFTQTESEFVARYSLETYEMSGCSLFYE